MTAVLLADDDIELSGMLTEYLEREGFAVTAVHDGESAARLALARRLPDRGARRDDAASIDGIEALRHIRQASRVPVVMLTARGDDIDRIVGLELGADDYVPKPCTPRELVARLRAILRRVQPQRGQRRAAHGQRPHAVAGEAARRMAGREPIELTSIEFNCSKC